MIYYVDSYLDDIQVLTISQFLNLFNRGIVDSDECYAFESQEEAEAKLKEITE